MPPRIAWKPVVRLAKHAFAWHDSVRLPVGCLIFNIPLLNKYEISSSFSFVFYQFSQNQKPIDFDCAQWFAGFFTLRKYCLLQRSTATNSAPRLYNIIFIHEYWSTARKMYASFFTRFFFCNFVCGAWSVRHILSRYIFDIQSGIAQKVHSVFRSWCYGYAFFDMFPM